MKRLIPIFIHLFLLLSFCMLSSSAKAQIVAPAGWNADSIRFALWGLYEWDPLDYSGVANQQLDTLMANFASDFGSIPYSVIPKGKRHYGFSGSPVGSSDAPLWAALSVKQSVFTPMPYPSAYNQSNGVGNGYYFRYNDSLGIWHNNQYDANDISPYMEFDSNRVLVNKLFTSRRYNNVPYSLCYGNEGRTSYDRLRRSTLSLVKRSRTFEITRNIPCSRISGRWRNETSKSTTSSSSRVLIKPSGSCISQETLTSKALASRARCLAVGLLAPFS